MGGEEDTGWGDSVNYKAILCSKIPDLFLDKLVAKNHFSKFGKITRFILRPSRQSCTVTYETEDQAERALNGAGDYHGIKFTVNYADREEGHVQNTEEWVDADVQAELVAMGHGAPTSTTIRASPFPTPARATLPTLPVKSSVPKPTKSAQLPIPVKSQSKVDDALYEELMSLLRRPAHTDEEKYRVLDARDKLMRMTMVRQTDIKKAVSTKGTCPDMCPEKERLMREFQRQVSSFEMSDNFEGDASTISHRRAIKEYSRSSADQEAPLSHELRNENVLKMTMLYLMHRIMDLCNDPQTSLGDWFHFVWDRTRSIRKDITQQELCSLGAVELVEQCARFHIHCAARLVAEDPSVFDKKINAENLTKCLQSLKYMYHDLRIKGVHCPCEAEFRSYIVLLNLGDSNFLWELKQLPEHIQKAGEIKRAIAFYNALQNNNFVRFFRMIREGETSYLSACILLGYFNKLRWRAMEAINKSHNWRKNSVMLPLKYLIRILGFEDQNAATEYFRYHGLQCDNGVLMLDRFTRPDIEYSMDRALQLVESKRIVSVGECVCGHTLESAELFELHVPHNSFDEDGMLKPSAWTIDVKNSAGGTAKLQTKVQQLTQNRRGSPSSAIMSAAPSVRTEPNIFKIPQASPPVSPKQNQQFKQTAQAASIIDSVFGREQISEPKPTPVMSDFKFAGAQQFGDTALNAESAFGTFKTSSTTDQNTSIFKVPIKDMKQTIHKPFENIEANLTGTGKSIFHSLPESTQHSSIASFKFADVPNSNTSTKGSSLFSTNAAPIEDTNTSIFKIPSVDMKKPSSATGFGGSIFPSNREQSMPVISNNLFAGTSVAGTGQGSIFSTAAKETANLFQSHQTKQAEPMKSDNIFKHFESGPSFPELDTTPMTSTDIFSVVKDKQPQQKSIVAEPRIDEANLKKQQLEKQKLLEHQKAEEEELQRKRIEAERKRKEILVKVEQNAELASKDEMNKFIIEQISSIAQSELARYQSLEEDCEDLLQLFFAEVTMDEVIEIANEEYALMCHDQLILCRYFERWVKYTRKKQEQRALMETTPIWVTTDTREEQTAKVTHPNQVENLQMIKRYRHGEPCNFKLLLWQNPSARAQDEVIDIIDIISSHMISRQSVKRGQLQIAKHFKLVLSLPNDTDELYGFESLCNKWLRKYIKCPENCTDNETPSYICAAKSNLALCVRKVTGTPPRNELGERVSNECDHADGIICFITCESLHSTRKRVHHLLKLSTIHKSVPVCFVVFDGQYNDELELSDVLQMESLVEDGKVFAYKFCGCLQAKSEFSFAHQLGRALRYVARESSFCNNETDALEMQKLQSWLEIGLGEEMWQRWQVSWIQNPIFAKMCCTPQHVVGLYNEALKRLRNLAAEDFQDAPEFPTELRKFVPTLNIDIPFGIEHFPKNWKCAQHQKEILNLISLLALPDIEEPVATEEIQLQLWLLNYAGRCIPHDEEASTLASFRAIKAMFEQLNCADLQEFELSERFYMINFLSVIKAIAFVHTNIVLKNYGLAGIHQLPAEIVYRRQAFLDYQSIPWWLNNKDVAAVTVDYRHLVTPQVEAIEAQADYTENSCQTMEQILRQAEEVSRKVEANLYTLSKQKVSTDTVELARDLETSLYQFELAKQIGAFEMPSMQDLDEISAVLEDAAEDDITTELQKNNQGDAEHNADKQRLTKKRKHADETEDYENIMSRAFSVIRKIEAQQDQHERLHKIAMIEFDA